MSFEALRALLASRAPRAYPLESIAPEHVPQGGWHEAAVLVPLFLKEGEHHVLLTRRRADLKRHAGQLSFPGGQLDPGEDSLGAALREAREEVGLDPAHVEILGQLSQCLVLVTGFRLTPWVGSVPYPYSYVPDPGEVEELLMVPLEALAAPGVLRTEMVERFGMAHEVHFYAYGRDTIWGATARVLKELLGIWNPS